MPKKPLSSQHSKFCMLMAGGSINQTHAYMEAYPNCIYDTARSGSAELITKDSIKDEISRLKGLSEEGDVLTRKEKREFLAKVKRTPIGEVDEDNELAQEVTTTEYYNKEGNLRTKKQVKMMSKQAAIDLDNKMSGDNEPDEIIHNIKIKWGDGE